MLVRLTLLLTLLLYYFTTLLGEDEELTFGDNLGTYVRESVLSIGTQFSNRVLTKLLTKLCGGTYVPRAERECCL